MTFADSATFLARFFPADTGAIAEHAAVLAAAQSLAGLQQRHEPCGPGKRDRHQRGAAALYRGGGLRAAEVHEAVAYVRALGGRLTLTAELGNAAPVTLT